MNCSVGDRESTFHLNIVRARWRAVSGLADFMGIPVFLLCSRLALAKTSPKLLSAPQRADSGDNIHHRRRSPNPELRPPHLVPYSVPEVAFPFPAQHTGIKPSGKEY